MTHPALLDVHSWRRLSDDDRADVARALAGAIGDGWAFTGDSLVHGPTGLPFVPVPGGRFTMGIAARDVAIYRRLSQPGDGDLRQLRELGAPPEMLARMEAALANPQWSPEFTEFVDQLTTRARPLHPVMVAPFLCAHRVLTLADATRLGVSIPGDDPAQFTRRAAAALARACGLRLPSEAELEWLAREGDPLQTFVLGLTEDDALPDHPFFRRRQQTWIGTADPFAAQWAADDWHPTYEGAPATSEPWMSGDPCGVTRGGCDPGLIMSRDVLVEALSGHRGEPFGDYATAAVRLACDLI